MSDWERKEADKKTSSVVLSLYNMLQETFSGQSFKITHQEAVLRQQNEFVVQVQRTSRKKEAGGGGEWCFGKKTAKSRKTRSSIHTNTNNVLFPNERLALDRGVTLASLVPTFEQPSSMSE